MCFSENQMSKSECWLNTEVRYKTWINIKPNTKQFGKYNYEYYMLKKRLVKTYILTPWKSCKTDSEEIKVHPVQRLNKIIFLYIS